MNTRDEATAWERGWAGHHAAQLRRLARLPLAEKLRWLEEAAQVAEHVAAAGRVARGEAARATLKTEPESQN